MKTVSPYKPDADLQKLCKRIWTHRKGSRKSSEEYAKKYGVHVTDLTLCCKLMHSHQNGLPLKRKWFPRIKVVHDRVREYHEKLKGGAQ